MNKKKEKKKKKGQQHGAAVYRRAGTACGAPVVIIMIIIKWGSHHRSWKELRLARAIKIYKTKEVASASAFLLLLLRKVRRQFKNQPSSSYKYISMPI